MDRGVPSLVFFCKLATALQFVGEKSHTFHVSSNSLFTRFQSGRVMYNFFVMIYLTGALVRALWVGFNITQR
jgi:hypothetical protein